MVFRLAVPSTASLLGTAATVAVAVGVVIARRRCRQLTASAHPPPPRKRIGVFNPRDGNLYNESVMQMMQELFAEIGASDEFALEELNVCERRVAELVPLLGTYDGFILAGSPASVAAGRYISEEPPGWIKPLEMLIRQLHAKRRPMLGICFGHQIMATALGGRVERSKHGLQGVVCGFDLTPLGAEVLLSSGSATGSSDGARRDEKHVELLCHNSDVVTRLPTCAANLGCSAANPAHVAAYFGTAAVARMAVTRGSLPKSAGGEDDSHRPQAFSFQGHPDFITPSGQRVLRALVLEAGEQWASQKMVEIESPTAAHASRQLFTAAVRTLWTGGS